MLEIFLMKEFMLMQQFGCETCKAGIKTNLLCRGFSEIMCSRVDLCVLHIWVHT